MKTNKLLIADAEDNSCVAQALTTLRKVLDYDPVTPEWIRAGFVNVDDLPQLVGKTFPNHVTEFYGTSKGKTFPDNVKYCGDYFAHSDGFDKLVAFMYYGEEDKVGHMVIGMPRSYTGMLIGCVIAIVL